ncbi:NAD(P)-binding protein [Dichomitus squalens LYAD-421 SS1]|uniref:NAD(P)-binding protein n=1 Tax=Dichomitus squalens (strain LYAD-421) TaxID=732165 RepID=R7SQ49_DICSQ|nr:NAD(P)-binding protein [Dichomitus squalens LYAD-421 SS1]EJF57880.1 NAD(P)-binding protein [Dichomitus squalens LYAD-421 SS1]
MGNALSEFQKKLPALGQIYPPKSKFSVDLIPDLTGRVIIVTGGNTGLGYETVKALLQHNAKVYLAARSKEKAEKAITSLKEATGKEAVFHELDLSDLAAVKKSAEDFLSKEKELHVLYNNAGVMWPPIEMLTKDGHDLQFGTNVVGPFLFTELLMPALIEGTKTSPDQHARVIVVSSSGAYAETLHWGTFKDSPERRKLSTQSLYYQSKHANVIVARQIAKRYADKGIVAISLNPGNITTDLQRYVPPLASKIMSTILLYPAPQGALTQLFAGTMPEALNYNGEYMIPWARLGKCRPECYNDEIGERLWKWLEDEVKSYRT